MMAWIVVAIGAAIGLLCLFLLLRPAALAPLLRRVFHTGSLYGVALLRLLAGAALIAAAGATAHPLLVELLGWLFVLAGLGLVVIPVRPLRRLADRFGDLSPLWLRCWLLAGLAFGGLLVYTGAA
jgi:hypothetical protein